MIKELCTRLTVTLAQRGAVPQQEIEIYAYGMQIGIELMLNVVTTLVLGLCIGMLLESVVLLAGYMLLRSYAGGYHAESALACYIQSCALIVVVLLFCKHLPADAVAVVSVAFVAVSGPVIFLLAPVAATHKPLEAIETVHYREKCRKRLVAEAVVLFVLMLMGFGRYALVLATGLFLIACLMIAGLIKNKLHPI